MKHYKPILLILTIILLEQAATWAQSIPLMIPHSGTVSVNGTPFNGLGQFKFAILNADGSTVFWSNDNQSPIDANQQPPNAVQLNVTNGLFSVKLGDTGLTNMQAIPTSVFNNSITFLRIWFNDGVTGFQQLSPDRQLVSVPYAFHSETAGSVSGTGVVGTNQIANGAVTSTQIANGTITGADILSSTSVNITDLTATGAVKLGPFSIRSVVTIPCPSPFFGSSTSALQVLDPNGTVLFTLGSFTSNCGIIRIQ